MGILYTGKMDYFKESNVLAQSLYVCGLTSTLCLALEYG